MRPIKKAADINKIKDRIRDSLSISINNYLRSKGWTYTCDTPGSYWLWSLTYEGKVIMVDATHAVGIQQALEDGAT